MATQIGTEAQLKAWDGTTDAELTADIDITSLTSLPITLSTSDITFNGNNYTVAFDSSLSSIKGIFDIEANVTIQNVIVKVNNTTSSAINGISSNHGGGLVKEITDTSCTISNCACIGPSSRNYDVYINGYSGGIVGRLILNGSYTVSITNCYTKATLNSDYSGGIIGVVQGTSSGTKTITLENCFHVGTVGDSHTGGMIGSANGSFNGFNFTFTNCYHSGIISGSWYCGGIWGYGPSSSASNSSVTMTNCYHEGSITDNDGGGMAGLLWYFDLTLTNCYSEERLIASRAVPSSYNSTNNSTNDQSVILEDGGADAYDNTGSGYRLQAFLSSPWNSDTYTTHNLDGTFLAMGEGSGGDGDPHITTIYGVKYNLLLKDYIRFFDNCNTRNRFLINGYIADGDDACSDMDYIRKVLVMHKDKRLVVDMGFRGQPVRVIENKGFDLDYNNLDFNGRVFRKCVMCDYTTDSNTDNSHNFGDHIVHPLIRNSVEFDVISDNIYHVQLSNVDEKNGNPCSIKITMKHNDKAKLRNYRGAVVSCKYRKNIKSLDDTSLLDDRIVSTEMSKVA